MSYASENLVVKVADQSHLEAVCKILRDCLMESFAKPVDIEVAEFLQEKEQWSLYLHGEPLFDDFFPPDTIEECMNAVANGIPGIDCTADFEHCSYSDGDDMYAFSYTVQNGNVTAEETEPSYYEELEEDE